MIVWDYMPTRDQQLKLKKKIQVKGLVQQTYKLVNHNEL